MSSDHASNTNDTLEQDSADHNPPDAEAAPAPAAEPADFAEQAAAIEAELAETRTRLGQVRAEVVITNHAMGLYELAAIHLSNQPPRLDQAALAIDAFACLVEGLGTRLGPEAATMRDALSQIRLAFVQIKGTVLAT